LTQYGRRWTGSACAAACAMCTTPALVAQHKQQTPGTMHTPSFLFFFPEGYSAFSEARMLNKVRMQRRRLPHATAALRPRPPLLSVRATAPGWAPQVLEGRVLAACCCILLDLGPTTGLRCSCGTAMPASSLSLLLQPCTRPARACCCPLLVGLCASLCGVATAASALAAGAAAGGSPFANTRRCHCSGPHLVAAAKGISATAVNAGLWMPLPWVLLCTAPPWMLSTRMCRTCCRACY